MSRPIWPVVTENLAQQLSAAQGGIVHAVQLMPYLPLSLELIEQTLDALTKSDRVEKRVIAGFSAYLFKESISKTPHRFAPRVCVYSNEPLDDFEHSVISSDVKGTVEAELANLAASDTWPALAVWQHELLYLAANLPAPVSASSIAGHSRLSFKRVEERVKLLQSKNVIKLDPELNAWELPPLNYPRKFYTYQDAFIRQFPGAIKEELEVRLVKGLSCALGILLLCFVLAVIGRIPFPLIFSGGLIASALVFLKILKSSPKPIPEI